MKKGIWKEIQTHLMTGIGYMCQVLTAAAVVGCFAQMIAEAMGFAYTDISNGLDVSGESTFVQFLVWIINDFQGTIQNLMYPFFAGFVAFSIADRPGLVVGFIGGVMSVSAGTGFFGALICGLAGGYFMKWVVATVKAPRQFRGIFNMMVYPFIGSVFMVTLLYFVSNPIGTWINTSFQNIISQMGDAGTIPLIIIMSCMEAFDLGGPVNCAAFSMALVMAADGFSFQPTWYACMIPPIGFGMAVIIDKFILRKKLFNDRLESAGYTAFISGFFGISEGAIPLMLDDPIVMVIINMFGATVGALAGHLAGNYNAIYPLGTLLGFLAQPNPVSYVGWLLFGAFIVAVLTLGRRIMLQKQGKLSTDDDEE